MDQDNSLITVKAVYCSGSSQEEIRRFNFPLPPPASGDAAAEQYLGLYEELRRRIAEICASGQTAESLSLYYVDADQERVRFSTSDELAQLLRLHQQSATSPTATLRILAEPTATGPGAGVDADGVEHPGVRCDGCNQSVRGRRFRCFQCPDYDLCQRCILRGVHDHHSMLVLHRPGDAESLPPWLSRMAAAGTSATNWMWSGAAGGPPGRYFAWQQQQQQQQPQGPGPHMFARPPFAGFGFGRCGGGGGGRCGGGGGGGSGSMTPTMRPPMPPHMMACPRLAKKLEKARYRFEAKMAKRCDRMQRKLAHRQQQQHQQQGCSTAAGSAEQPIRIDIDEQQMQQQQCEQQQQQQQLLTPEEALLLKQLKKRHRQSGAAAASKKKAKKQQKQKQHHHKRGRGGRKRRLSSSSSSSSSGSSDSDSSASSTSGSSDSDSDSDAAASAKVKEQKSYRQLLKRFKKMGFKDDETCWLRELIREKRGNLNEILDAIRQRGGAAGASRAV